VDQKALDRSEIACVRSSPVYRCCQQEQGPRGSELIAIHQVTCTGNSTGSPSSIRLLDVYPGGTMRLEVGETQTCRKNEWTPALATEVMRGRNGDALSRFANDRFLFLLSNRF
jgi:hypothetical protein